MRSPTRRRSVWFAAACLALLVGGLAVQGALNPPVASAQDTALNPWDCEAGGGPIRSGLAEVSVSEMATYCSGQSRQCDQEQSDPALESYCARIWCKWSDRPDSAPPEFRPALTRTPRYTQGGPVDAGCGLFDTLYGGEIGQVGPEYHAQRCPAEAELIPQLPSELASFCLFLRMRCDTPMRGGRSDSHNDYCREILRGEEGLPEGPEVGAGGAGGGLGDGSRLCEMPEDRVSDATARNCENSGSAFRFYELSDYGLDQWVDVGAGIHPKFDKFDDSALQGVAQWVWRAFIQIVDAILTLLEWALTLDLIDGSFNKLEDALLYIHKNVLGTPWTLAAIAVAGLWGIWNGLVRLRTIETLGSLAVTLVMMIAALVIIHDPLHTVWKYSALANDAAMSVFSGVASGDLGDPDPGDEAGSVWKVLVHEPWCAMQFGDVEYCNQHYSEQFGENLAEVSDPAPDQEQIDSYVGLSVAGAWLACVSEGGETGAGAPCRKALYLAEERCAQEGHRCTEEDAGAHPNRISLMNDTGTVDRLGLLAVIAVALLGAILLLAWLDLKIVIAAIMVLILALITPVMLLVAAFGDAGRSAFVTWAKRLLAAIVAKLIYAMFLAVVILVASIIVSLNLGWYPQWLILLVFWWGVFLKRSEIVGFLDSGEQSAWPRLASIYYGYRMSRDALRAATGLPRAVARGGRKLGGAANRAVAGERLERAAGIDAAIGDRAEDVIRSRGTAELERRRDNARNVVGQADRRREAEKRQRDAAGNLARENQKLAQLRARQRDAGPSAELSEQIDQQKDHVNQLRAESQQADAAVRAQPPAADPDRVRAAQAVVSRYGDGSTPIGERDVDGWVEQRRGELRGQDPARDSARDRRERELLRRADQEGGLTGRERRRARSDPATRPLRRDVRERTREARQDLHRARVRRRVG